MTGTIEGHIVKRWFKRFIIAGIVGFLLMIGIVVWIRSARISRGIEQRVYDMVCSRSGSC